MVPGGEARPATDDAAGVRWLVGVGEVVVLFNPTAARRTEVVELEPGVWHRRCRGGEGVSCCVAVMCANDDCSEEELHQFVLGV